MKRKNVHAVALSKLGAAKGGKARAAALTPEELSEIGRKGGKARWAGLSPEERSEVARKTALTRRKKSKRRKAGG